MQQTIKFLKFPDYTNDNSDCRFSGILQQLTTKQEKIVVELYDGNLAEINFPLFFVPGIDFFDHQYYANLIYLSHHFQDPNFKKHVRQFNNWIAKNIEWERDPVKPNRWGIERVKVWIHNWELILRRRLLILEAHQNLIIDFFDNQLPTESDFQRNLVDFLIEKDLFKVNNQGMQPAISILDFTLTLKNTFGFKTNGDFQKWKQLFTTKQKSR